MRYFNHQYNDSMGNIWSLFTGLSEVTKEEVFSKNKRYDYSHTLDIIKSAMNGNLRSDNFNLVAYELTCAKTDAYGANEERSNILSIVDVINGNDSYGDRVRYGEISSNDPRLHSIDKAFEELENNSEFEQCLKELYNIRKDYIVEKGIDPVEMLVRSLQGIPEAVSNISEMVVSDLKLSAIIEALCESGANVLKGRLEESFQPL